MKGIPFESWVRDKVTGFSGIVVFRIEHMNDCVRYGVQPVVGKDKQLPEYKVLEGPNLEITALPKDKLPPAEETPNTLELGAKLRDRLTGLEGIAVLRVKHRYSGDRYGIQPPVDKTGEVPEVRTFDEEDLEQIDPPPTKKRRRTKAKTPSGPHDSSVAIAR